MRHIRYFYSFLFSLYSCCALIGRLDVWVLLQSCDCLCFAALVVPAFPIRQTLRSVTTVQATASTATLLRGSRLSPRHLPGGSSLRESVPMFVCGSPCNFLQRFAYAVFWVPSTASAPAANARQSMNTEFLRQIQSAGAHVFC